MVLKFDVVNNSVKLTKKRYENYFCQIFFQITMMKEYVIVNNLRGLLGCKFAPNSRIVCAFLDR